MDEVSGMDASLPAAEILVEGELSPFEHEALCLLELPPSTNGGLRVRVSSAFYHLQGFIATEGFPHSGTRPSPPLSDEVRRGFPKGI